MGSDSDTKPSWQSLLCVLPRQVPLRKVHGVAELHHLAQEIGTMAEALQNARHLLPAGLRAPFVIDLGDFAGRVLVFNELDLGFLFGIRELIPR